MRQTFSLRFKNFWFTQRRVNRSCLFASRHTLQSEASPLSLLPPVKSAAVFKPGSEQEETEKTETIIR